VRNKEIAVKTLLDGWLFVTIHWHSETKLTQRLFYLWATYVEWHWQCTKFSRFLCVKFGSYNLFENSVEIHHSYRQQDCAGRAPCPSTRVTADSKRNSCH